MSRSKIEWTEFTWNPVTGCTKVSPGKFEKHPLVVDARENYRHVRADVLTAYDVSGIIVFEVWRMLVLAARPKAVLP